MRASQPHGLLKPLTKSHHLSSPVGAIGALLASLFLAFSTESMAADQRQCTVFHDINRGGSLGPALLFGNLSKLPEAETIKTNINDWAATQMVGFTDRLAGEEIAALADNIYGPASPVAQFGEVDIKASHVVHDSSNNLPPNPAGIFKGVDMMNLFIVFETGDHHVTVLDGDRLVPIHRFVSHHALHGDLKVTPDGRYVYFASRDGWISKFDIWNLALVAETRVGFNTRNLALSADGKYVAVANHLPRTLVFLDADLKLLKLDTVTDKSGEESSRVSAVYDAGPRLSFVAALEDIPEVWEISYNPQKEDIPMGAIHDFQYKEGVFIPGFLNPRRSSLSEPLHDFFFTQNYDELIGSSGETGMGQVINLDVRKKIADLELSGLPHLGASITWKYRPANATSDHDVMATPNLKNGYITVVDLVDWKTIKVISTPGSSPFIRSHNSTPYAWAGSLTSGVQNTLLIFDKKTLEKVAELKIDPEKSVTHVEFTRDGRYALASLRDSKADCGALIVFDAITFKEVERIPMDKPTKIYNLFNTIDRSEKNNR